VASDCWLWTGYIKPDGYGQTGRNRQAHRVVWEALNGPLPNGHDLHHTCPNRHCVNPAHVEALSHADHGRVSMQHKTERTHCPHGHPLSGDNLYVPPGRRDRQCRACRREARKRVRS
jgi:hypothetical protein